MTYYVFIIAKFDISQNSFNNDGCAPQAGVTLSGTFAETTQCPFSQFSASGGGLFAGVDPCDVCVFPSMEQTGSCRRAVRQYCQSFFEVDQDTLGFLTNCPIRLDRNKTEDNDASLLRQILL